MSNLTGVGTISFPKDLRGENVYLPRDAEGHDLVGGSTELVRGMCVETANTVGKQHFTSRCGWARGVGTHSRSTRSRRKAHARPILVSAVLAHPLRPNYI